MAGVGAALLIVGGLPMLRIKKRTADTRTDSYDG
jgi:hypothetical protein